MTPTEMDDLDDETFDGMVRLMQSEARSIERANRANRR